MTITLLEQEDQYKFFSVGKEAYRLHLFAFRGMMYYDVELGGKRILTSMRVLPWKWMLPYPTLSKNSNFRFETGAADAKEYPWYEDFNTKFKLVAYTKDELDKLGGD